MISVLYDNISMLFDFKTMHNSTIKFKCIQYLVLVLDIGIYCMLYIVGIAGIAFAIVRKE